VSLLCVPIAPASKSASACTKPNPLAAPETSTTLSTKLNSGKRFVVPRYVGAGPVSPWERASASASGGGGGGLVAEGSQTRGVIENVRACENAGKDLGVCGLAARRQRDAARGRERRVVFILTTGSLGERRCCFRVFQTA
jgi:hypothetical protein